MASASTLEVTDANFESEVLKSQVPVLVDFWAEWCGPCRMLTPTIDAIAAETGTNDLEAMLGHGPLVLPRAPVGTWTTGLPKSSCWDMDHWSSQEFMLGHGPLVHPRAHVGKRTFGLPSPRGQRADAWT